MSHTFHQLFFHFIWATHSRDPHLHRSFRPEFLTILSEEVKKRGGLPIRHNSMPDHVHLLVRLDPNIRLSDFIGQVKGGSAYRVNHEVKPKFKLTWQEGYGVVSLRKGEVETVSRYIDNQEEHHQSNRLSAILERVDGQDED